MTEARETVVPSREGQAKMRSADGTIGRTYVPREHSAG